MIIVVSCNGLGPLHIISYACNVDFQMSGQIRDESGTSSSNSIAGHRKRYCDWEGVAMTDGIMARASISIDDLNLHLGLPLNLGKSGGSLSFGLRGTKFTMGSTGKRSSSGLR